MSLASGQLDAFLEVAKTGSFSKAAQNLFITQSALSQRIINLEDELGTTLVIRDSSGIRLTTTGEELLQYCRTKQSLESEFLSNLKEQNSKNLSGIVRVAGFSTIMRSVVLPSLRDLICSNQDVHLEMITREIREIPKLLRSTEVDFSFLDRSMDRAGIESILVGYEEYVLIESKSHSEIRDVYLDHDVEDETTRKFFDIQAKKPKKLIRSFLDEIYSLIDGVAIGLGRAVAPMHIIKNDDRVQMVLGFKSLMTPVYLNYYQQPFYTKLHRNVLSALVAGSGRHLHQAHSFHHSEPNPVQPLKQGSKKNETQKLTCS